MDVALKVNYNDGSPGLGIGYKGVCTEQNIIRNMKRVNCSLTDNPCRLYYEHGFKPSERPATKNQCYEKNLFLKWQFGAGMYHHGNRTGKPIPIKKINTGDIAVLTTRFPDSSEEERKIIGLYKMASLDTSRGNSDGYLIEADKDVRLELPADLAGKLNFWNYHKNKNGNGIGWNEGLFRYLEKLEVDAIISDLYYMVNEESQRTTLNMALVQRNIQKPLKINRSEFIENVITQRKYGAGGEGLQHKELKEWVARNPALLGLKDVQNTEIDCHTFLSGDRPDILFKCNSGYAVVEIVTIDPYPGAYQAIKYRDLLCAELGLPLNSRDVKSFLVAYSIPPEVNGFCKRYEILTKEKDLGMGKTTRT